MTRRLAILFTLCVAATAPPQLPGEPPVMYDVAIGGETFRLEVAADYDARARGLSNRTSIAPDGGMLFLYNDAAIRGYWMIDCLVAMDLIFLDPAGRITALHAMPMERPRGDRESQAAYEGRLPRYSSERPSPISIELATGSIRRLGLQVGDQINVEPGRLRSMCVAIEAARRIERTVGRDQPVGDNGWWLIASAAAHAEEVTADSAHVGEIEEKLAADGTFTQLSLAVDMPRCIRGLDTRPDLFSADDHYQGLLVLGRARAHSLRLAFQAGDEDAAEVIIDELVRYADQLRRQAGPFDRSVAHSVWHETMHVITDAMSEDRIDGALARRILIAIDRLPLPPMDEIVRAETDRWRAMLTMVHDESGDMARPFDPGTWAAHARGRADRAALLRDAMEASMPMHSPHFAALRLQMPETPLVEPRALRGAIEKYRRTWTQQADRPRASRRVSSADVSAEARAMGSGAAGLALAPVVLAVLIELDDRIAFERVTLIVRLALDVWFDEHGRYPSRLRDLRPSILRQIPPDPLTGSAFRYEAVDDGASYRFYGVGLNRRDDGGVIDDDQPWLGRYDRHAPVDVPISR